MRTNTYILVSFVSLYLCLTHHQNLKIKKKKNIKSLSYMYVRMYVCVVHICDIFLPLNGISKS